MPLSPSSIAPTIRACKATDASLLSLVGAATFFESYAGRLPAEAVLHQCLHGHSVPAWQLLLDQPHTQAWLAELSGAPVGYATVASPDFPGFRIEPQDLEVKRIYVFSRLHGTGLGSSLMDTVISKAAEAGASRLLLGVHRDNARALAFYHRNDFWPVGTRTFQLGSVIFDDLILGRTL